MTHNKIDPHLISPEDLIQSLLPAPTTLNTIVNARNIANSIIQGVDKRLLVIVGPCSIHDYGAAMEYASLLKQAARRFQDELHIIMRAYFEKPRTITGWKGLISDPRLNGTFDVNHGLKLARTILLEINQLDLPAATEFIDTITPQYLSDLVAWSAIGARTSESQLHRALASGLALPVGFKNTTDGNINIAIDAVNAARFPHQFLSISMEGKVAIIETEGNSNCHIILRGSRTRANYSKKCIQGAVDHLKKANLNTRLMIDCSHGNSRKHYLRQKQVIDYVAQQIKEKNTAICGVMLESNLIEGKQTLDFSRSLNYGQSITDSCLSWRDTEPLLEKLALAVKSIYSNAGVIPANAGIICMK